MIRQPAFVFACVVLLLSGATPTVSLARAQGMPAVATAPPADVTSPPSGTAPPATAATLPPGWRLGAGQAPVVGGNSAGARERALNEAFKQAVDQALATFLDSARRVSEGRTVNQVLGRPRAFISRYRTLEDGEAGALYRVRLEAEIDQNALERAFVHAPGLATANAGRGTGASGFLVASSLLPEEGALLTAALKKLGLRAEAAPTSVATASTLAPVLEAATKASLLAVVSLLATSSDDGVVRGVGLWSTSCRLHARVMSAPAGESLADLEVSDRGFGPQAAAAKTACLTLTSEALASQLAPFGEGPAESSGVRPLVLEVTTREPGALPQLVKALRSMAAVSGAELRHIAGGKADLWVRTTLPPAGLLAALERDHGTGLQITPTPGGDSGDRLRIGLHLEPAVQPPSADASPPPGSPSPQAKAAAAPGSAP